MHTKSQLRKHFKQIRQSQSGKLSALQHQLQSALKSLARDDSTIACYVALPGEIDVLTPFQSTRQKLALPRMQGTNLALVFHAYRHGEALITDPTYGIQEPTETAEIVIPDIILLPALAVDKQGNRLGYGGGYYDRTLLDLRAAGHDPITIAVIYDAQRANEPLPAEPTDQHVNYTLTESGLHVLSQRDK